MAAPVSCGVGVPWAAAGSPMAVNWFAGGAAGAVPDVEAWRGRHASDGEGTCSVGKTEPLSGGGGGGAVLAGWVPWVAAFVLQGLKPGGWATSLVVGEERKRSEGGGVELA